MLFTFESVVFYMWRYKNISILLHIKDLRLCFFNYILFLDLM